jgi:hypothetical protein
MFDSYTVRAGDQHHHHRTEVHEHRAPTDASVKLLREMEQAALDKVLGAIRLEGCPVDCVILRMREGPSAADPFALGHHFVVRYKLGAHAREFRHHFRPDWKKSAQEVNDDCYSDLRRALAEDISHYLLGGPFADMLRKQGFDLT